MARKFILPLLLACFGLFAESNDLNRLLEGNRRFMNGDLLHPNRTLERRKSTVTGQEPFAVINADDYYGVEGFSTCANFLINECRPQPPITTQVGKHHPRLIEMLTAAHEFLMLFVGEHLDGLGERFLVEYRDREFSGRPHCVIEFFCHRHRSYANCDHPRHKA